MSADDARPLTEGLRVHQTGSRAQYEGTGKTEPHASRALPLSRVGSWEYDLSATTVLWSPELFSIFGIDSDVGHPTYPGFLARIHPDDRETFAEAVEEAITHNKPFRIDLKLFRSDGVLRHIINQGSTHTGKDGSVDRVFGSVEDITEWIQTGQALRESEAKYRSIFENAVEGIFQVTPEGRILSGNPAMARILGYSTVDEMMANAADLGKIHIIPGRGEEFPGFLERHGKVEGFETRFLRKDGVTIWAIINARTVKDAAGKTVYFEGSIEDITYRKRTEDALRESEERYRAIIEHSNDGVAIMSGDNHAFVNKRFLEIFGYDRPADVVGKPLSLTAHHDDRERVIRFNRQRQRNEPVPSMYEMKGVKKNGDIVYVEVSATNITLHGEPASLAYLRDVTGRKQWGKELAESMERIIQAKQEWESLADSLNELIFLLDSRGYIIRSNRRIENWGLGHITDVKGRRLHDTMHPYCAKPHCYLRTFMASALKDSTIGRPAEIEVKDDVLKRYLDIRMRPIPLDIKAGSQLRESFAVLVIHDISERKKAQESLSAAYEELKEAQQELIRIEKLALLGKFSSGIAHEIRNPLANIRASAQFCLNKYELDEEIKKHLRIMLRNSEHANKIIKDLIDLAKPSEVSLVPGNINLVVNKVCDLVKTRCEKQHVLLHKKISRRLPPILMDEERMEKALLNFVLNALDAMPKGGKLAINAYPYFNKHEVVISILDTGKGIAPEHMDKIFHPFFTTKRTGIGLGLCLADQVITSHKGRLSFRSELGEGTAITVKLPISREG